MKNTINSLILIMLFLCSTKTKGQQRVIDSLQQILHQSSINADQRAMTMAKLADAIAYKNLPLAFEKNKQALAIAKENNDPSAISYLYAEKVSLYVLSDNISLAQKAADSAVLMAKNASSFIKGIAWYRQGYLQNIQNNPDKAFKSWQISLNYLNSHEGALYQSSIYYLLYGIYAERNDSINASNYAQQSLKKAIESNDAGMITAAWQINGTNYLQTFQSKKDSTFLDSAVYAFKQSVNIYQAKKEWIRNQSVVALSALNLADIYMDYYPPWFKDSILNYVNLALSVSLETDNKTMQANCYEIIGKLNTRNGNWSLAEEALLKEKAIVETISPPNYFLSTNLYQSLAKLKEHQGNSSAALKYYKQYIDFFQKEFNAQQFETIQKLKAKYQNEKKEKELKLLQLRTAFQKKQSYLYIGISMAAVLGLIFLFIAYHFRLKYSLQREKLLQQQKEEAHLLAKLNEQEAVRLTLKNEEIELHSKLKTEEAARLQAEQDLMQSQKQQLQKELLAGVLQIEHKNELLQNLKDKLLANKSIENPTKHLERIINEELRVDEDFENIKSEFKEVHPHFFNQLQLNAGSKLSQLDLKYCAYIYMQLSAKQIAALLHIEPKSVRMTRYRLKQKLALGKDDDLDNFIKKIAEEK